MATRATNYLNEPAMTSSKTVNTCFLVGISFICIGLFTASYHLPKFQWDPVGMGFWPRILILMLLGLVAFLLIHTFVFGRAEAVRKVDLGGFRLPLLGLPYAYLLEPVGFMLITPPFLLLLALGWSPGFDAGRWFRAGLVAIGGTLLVFLVFEWGIRVELPRGLLDW